jgi:hypothetical protein
MRIVAFTAALLILGAGSARADDTDGCARFTWDVSRELAVMKQAPQPLTAAVKAADSAQLQPEQLYALKLAPQGSVAYLVPPGKPTLDDSAQGGMVQLRVPSAGVYRVSVAGGQWIDVVADGKLVKSRDFQGARGCERPHKIVEFELPANTALTLQFSGAASPTVLVAVTAVTAPAQH